MKLVTACGDQTSKLCSVLPSGTITELKEFVHCSSVKSAMFCPGSSGWYYYMWLINVLIYFGIAFQLL